MENVLKQILAGQQQIFHQIDQIESEVSALTSDRHECGAMIKAWLHHQEFAIAKLEGLELNTASKESLQNLATKNDIHDLGAKFAMISPRSRSGQIESHKIKNPAIAGFFIFACQSSENSTGKNIYDLWEFGLSIRPTR